MDWDLIDMAGGLAAFSRSGFLFILDLFMVCRIYNPPGSFQNIIILSIVIKLINRYVYWGMLVGLLVA